MKFKISKYEFDLKGERVSEVQDKFDLLTTTAKLMGYEIEGSYLNDLSYEKINLYFKHGSKEIEMILQSWNGVIDTIKFNKYDYSRLSNNSQLLSSQLYIKDGDLEGLIEIVDDMLNYI